MSDLFDDLVKLGNSRPNLRDNIAPILHHLKQKRSRVTASDAPDFLKEKIDSQRDAVRWMEDYLGRVYENGVDRVSAQKTGSQRDGDHYEFKIYEDLSGGRPRKLQKGIAIASNKIQNSLPGVKFEGQELPSNKYRKDYLDRVPNSPQFWADHPYHAHFIINEEPIENDIGRNDEGEMMFDLIPRRRPADPDSRI